MAIAHTSGDHASLPLGTLQLTSGYSLVGAFGWFPEPEGILETLCPSGVPLLWVCLADNPGVAVNAPITPPPSWRSSGMLFLEHHIFHRR